MTANDIYTVAGSATGASGNSGDGGAATSGLMTTTESVSLDPEGDLYVTDNSNNTVREIASATAAAIPPAPGQTSALVIAPAGTAPGGITITQPGGAQITFYPKTGSTCTTPYVVAGGYCALPQDVGATLSYNSGTGIYTFTQSPGTVYTYASGQLASETDAAGQHPGHHLQHSGTRVGALPVGRALVRDNHRRVRPDPRLRLRLLRPGHLRHRPSGPTVDLRLQLRR